MDVINAPEPDFTELDGEITRVERCLNRARENGFPDLVALIERDIATVVTPVFLALICRLDGSHRAEAARRYRRLQKAARVRRRRGEDRLTVISWRAFMGLLWATENEARPRPVRRLLRFRKCVAATKTRRPPGSRA